MWIGQIGPNLIVRSFGAAKTERIISMEEKVLPSIIRACDVPEPDTSYMLPWSLEMLYEIEPRLKELADEAVSYKRKRNYQVKRDAYIKARNASWELVGWGARDPRLRNSGAYDCFTHYILDELKI